MKVARDEKQKKTIWVFFLSKYSKFRSNSLKFNLERKSFILEVCDIWRWVHDEGVFLSFRSSQIVVDYCITASSKGAKNERNSLNLIQHGVLYMFGGCGTIFGFGPVWVWFGSGLGKIPVIFR